MSHGSPHKLVARGLTALFDLAADPSANLRPRPHAFSLLEDRVAEWLRFYAIPHADSDTADHELEVMARQVVIIETAKVLVAAHTQGGYPAFRVSPDGRQAQIRLHGCPPTTARLQPEPHPEAYSLGFWPHGLAFDGCDPGEQALQPLADMSPVQARQWLHDTLERAYR